MPKSWMLSVMVLSFKVKYKIGGKIPLLWCLSLLRPMKIIVNIYHILLGDQQKKKDI